MAGKKRNGQKHVECKSYPKQIEPGMRDKKPEEAQNGAAEKGKRNSLSRFELGTIIISCLALLVSIVTAYFVYGQIKEMRVGTQLDQRAWVGFFDETISTVNDEKEKHFKLGLTVKNTGKTPAVGVSVEAITAPRLWEAPPTWEDFEKDLRSSYAPSDSGEITTVYVGPNVGALSARNKLQSNILAPGATQTWNYEIFRRKLDEDPDRRRQWFLVRITYTDVSHKEHTTEMCFMNVLGYQVEHCSAGNHMD